MPLISVIVVLAIAGVALWLINSYIPMDKKMKTILTVVVIIIVAIWLLQAFGVLGNINGINNGDNIVWWRNGWWHQRNESGVQINLP